MTRLFISHAFEDKEYIVKPLVTDLIKSGFDIWYDEFEIQLGDSILLKIDEGLKICDFGIIILSKHFIRKKWTKREFEILMSREINENQKRILPIVHDVSNEELFNFSASLASKLFIRTDVGNKKIIKSIKDSTKKNELNFKVSYSQQNIIDIHTIKINGGIIQKTYLNNIGLENNPMDIILKENFLVYSDFSDFNFYDSFIEFDKGSIMLIDENRFNLCVKSLIPRLFMNYDFVFSHYSPLDRYFEYDDRNEYEDFPIKDCSLNIVLAKKQNIELLSAKTIEGILKQIINYLDKEFPFQCFFDSSQNFSSHIMEEDEYGYNLFKKLMDDNEIDEIENLIFHSDELRHYPAFYFAKLFLTEFSFKPELVSKTDRLMQRLFNDTVILNDWLKDILMTIITENGYVLPNNRS